MHDAAFKESTWLFKNCVKLHVYINCFIVAHYFRAPNENYMKCNCTRTSPTKKTPSCQPNKTKVIIRFSENYIITHLTFSESCVLYNYSTINGYPHQNDKLISPRGYLLACVVRIERWVPLIILISISCTNCCARYPADHNSCGLYIIEVFYRLRLLVI